MKSKSAQSPLRIFARRLPDTTASGKSPGKSNCSINCSDTDEFPFGFRHSHLGLASSSPWSPPPWPPPTPTPSYPPSGRPQPNAHATPTHPTLQAWPTTPLHPTLQLLPASFQLQFPQLVPRPSPCCPRSVLSPPLLWLRLRDRRRTTLAPTRTPRRKGATASAGRRARAAATTATESPPTATPPKAPTSLTSPTDAARRSPITSAATQATWPRSATRGRHITTPLNPPITSLSRHTSQLLTPSFTSPSTWFPPPTFRVLSMAESSKILTDLRVCLYLCNCL
ncbi:gametogenetin-like [Penaeus chinensis]|uniref:gametogenetin-like n=1 Tax=Penaeus chinensis TaxID=139456 RepID=UPI001FB7BDE7|nr:gametogenetin-like [Penaeus chinensis]